MQALAKRPTTGGFNAAPKLWLHSCAKKCQDCIDSERRHSRLRKAGRYRFMQVNEMENSTVTDWGNHNLGSTIILASVHCPDDPVSPRMLSRNAKKMAAIGSIKYFEVCLYELLVWPTLRRGWHYCRCQMRSSHWCLGIWQGDANLSNVVILTIKHRASLDGPLQVFISTEKVSKD